MGFRRKRMQTWREGRSGWWSRKRWRWKGTTLGRSIRSRSKSASKIKLRSTTNSFDTTSWMLRHRMRNPSSSDLKVWRVSSTLERTHRGSRPTTSTSRAIGSHWSRLKDKWWRTKLWIPRNKRSSPRWQRSMQKAPSISTKCTSFRAHCWRWHNHKHKNWITARARSCWDLRRSSTTS